MGGRKKKASMRLPLGQNPLIEEGDSEPEPGPLPISTPERRTEDEKHAEVVAERENLDRILLDRILKGYVDNMNRLEAKGGKRNDE